MTQGVRIEPVTRDDLYVDYLDSGRAERLPFNTEANEYQGVVSPDDRWLAYVTDASGRDEVRVASFPSGGGKQVSIDGGASPQWTTPTPTAMRPLSMVGDSWRQFVPTILASRRSS